MSLGKLLTTGKSLVGLQDGGRYRMSKGGLPKFKSSKNPFAVKQPDTESASTGAEPELPKLSPAEIAAANLKKTQAIPALDAKVEAGEAQTQTVVSTEVAAPVDGWIKKLNPLVWWENRKPAMPVKAPLTPRPIGKRPVQAELSLDNIKVMRNDLNDTDVEVVAAQPKQTPAANVSGGAAAATMAVPELPSPRHAWEFLGERLLGRH
jgi:hypothetical protein